MHCTDKVCKFLDDFNESLTTISNYENKSRKNRTSFTAKQLDILEAAFKANTYPDHDLRLKIAAATNLDVNKIQVSINCIILNQLST